MLISRRRFLAASGAATFLTVWPGTGLAAPADDTRLLVVLLRGALDGLHALVPRDDADYRRLRGALAPEQTLALEGSFALHPKLAFAHELYGRGQYLPLVAMAPPYRQRSHFEAQDCLENGTARPSGASTGWLGRCAAAMRPSPALTVSAVMPLIMRGEGGNITSWSPPLPRGIDPILLQRLQPLYAADTRLHADFERALQGLDAQAVDAEGGRMAQAMRAAAQAMSATPGARIAFVEDSGWDTHANQAAVLDRKLAELDGGLRAFHEAAGTIWNRTVVAVVTEFGRTAAVNGTGGTDHGTGGVAFLAGGAVKGGRVGGDWPGLSPSALNEGRDLRATGDLRALFKTLLAGHLRVDEGVLETKIFPDSRAVRAMPGLLA